MKIIRARMDELGVTAADLSRKTDIPPPTLSKILNCKRLPLVSTVRSIILALDLTMPKVLGVADAAVATDKFVAEPVST
jgi:predicted transcriptional regulator